MGASVNFSGKENVLTAYRNRDIPTWAIFQAKNLVTAGDDEASLTAYLDMLMAGGGTDPVYTLKVYNGDLDPDTITDRTEANGAFNFKLFGSGGMLGGTGGPHNIGTMMQNKVYGALQADIEAMIDERLGREPAKQKTGIGGLIDGLLNDPDELVNFIGKIKNIFSPSPMQPYGNVRLAGIPGQAKTTEMAGTLTPEEKMERIAAVIDRLERADPKLLSHLEKLAELAEKKPFIFSAALQQIETL